MNGQTRTFLAKQCTYGEDRALTNLILEKGFDTVYQRTAVVHTVVPWTYEKLYKMHLRYLLSGVMMTDVKMNRLRV